MKQFDLLGIGNSVVDVLYKVDDEFIKNNKLEKGVMTLIDEEKAEKFYSKVKQHYSLESCIQSHERLYAKIAHE